MPVTDTDTLCALSLLIASRDLDTLDDLSVTLHENLEKSPYGYDYLAKLDQKLIQAFPRLKIYNNKADHNLTGKLDL